MHDTPPMRRYILRRLMLMPLTLIGITFLVFCLTRMVPGGPVERMLQEQAVGALSGEKAIQGSVDTVSEDDLERLEEMFGLHEPMWKARSLKCSVMGIVRSISMKPGWMMKAGASG